LPPVSPLFWHSWNHPFPTSVFLFDCPDQVQSHLLVSFSRPFLPTSPFPRPPLNLGRRASPDYSESALLRHRQRFLGFHLFHNADNWSPPFPHFFLPHPLQPVPLFLGNPLSAYPRIVPPGGPFKEFSFPTTPFFWFCVLGFLLRPGGTMPIGSFPLSPYPLCLCLCMPFSPPLTATS